MLVRASWFYPPILYWLSNIWLCLLYCSNFPLTSTVTTKTFCLNFHRCTGKVNSSRPGISLRCFQVPAWQWPLVKAWNILIVLFCNLWVPGDSRWFIQLSTMWSMICTWSHWGPKRALLRKLVTEQEYAHKTSKILRSPARLF